MNPANCSVLFRSDNILLYEAPPDLCEIPVLAYAFLTSILIVGRISVAAMSWRIWRAKYLKRSQTGNRFPQQRNRLPIQPSLYTSSCVIQLLFFILAGLDVISSRNGTTGVLYWIWSVIIAIQCLLYLRKIVHLGIRIVPLTKAHVQISNSSSDKGTFFSREKDEKVISKFDLILKVNVVLIGICILTSMVGFVILAAIVFPGRLWGARIGFGSQACFLLLWDVSIAYQFERCILAVKSTMKRDEEQNMINREKQKTLFQNTLRVMRLQQFMIICFVTPIATVYTLHAANVVPFTWLWLLIFHSGTDIIFFLILILSKTVVAKCLGWRKKKKNNIVDDELDGTWKSKQTKYPNTVIVTVTSQNGENAGL